tara:strand:+ start:6428 stop:6667 length:240 start_codon:yes stop_codon:yes gene_type:complete
MRAVYKVGDLVHIPQSVNLIDCDPGADPQMMIPLRFTETTEPAVGVVTRISDYGYVRVFCNGTMWSVKDGSVFRLDERK